MSDIRPFNNVTRRTFLTLLTSAALSTPVLAAGQEQDEAEAGVAQVEFGPYSQETQAKPEWCWAACISMVFAFYGHTVSPARIIAEAYGTPDKIKAGYGINLAKKLNRKWKDEDGQFFNSVVTTTFDADANYSDMNDSMMIEELKADHPVVMGSGSHAMVLTLMEYESTERGPIVSRYGVVDPWPGKGDRDLTEAEMVAGGKPGGFRFAATVRVENAEADKK